MNSSESCLDTFRANLDALAQAVYGLDLQLAHSLSGHTVLGGDLLERVLFSIVESESAFDDVSLALGQLVEYGEDGLHV